VWGEPAWTSKECDRESGTLIRNTITLSHARNKLKANQMYFKGYQKESVLAIVNETN
jgi:hypothetical protein